MAKTNYSKVEEVLAEGLQKITVAQYLAAAPSRKEKISSEEQVRVAERNRLLRVLHTELHYLQKNGHPVFEKFQIKRKWIEELLEKPESITSEEWGKIVFLKTALTEFKKGLITQSAEEINAGIIKEQTKKSLTKRFNVNDKWLPL